MHPKHFGTAKRFITLLTVAILLLFFSVLDPVSGPAFAWYPQKDSKQPEPQTKLRITVTGGEKDVPVSNASVYVRFPQEFNRSKLLEMALKTSQEGTVKVPPVPRDRGKIMIQVVASGWKPFGQWYTFEKDEESIAIKLERPPHWY